MSHQFRLSEVKFVVQSGLLPESEESGVSAGLNLDSAPSDGKKQYLSSIAADGVLEEKASKDILIRRCNISSGRHRPWQESQHSPLQLR